MRPVSGRFAGAIAEDQELAVRAWILDGESESELDTVTGGTVTLDSRSATRGRCDVTIADDGLLGLIPTTPASPLAPYGNEIRLERGLVYPDGTEELVSLGVFRIEDADIDDSGAELAVRIVGLDRSKRIIDGRFVDPYQVAAGTDYAEAILATWQQVYPDVETRLTETSRTTPDLFAEEMSDRWAFTGEMATALGMEQFFDGDGVGVLQPIPTAVTGSAVAELTEGEDGVLVRAGRRWSRQGSYNAVKASGEKMADTAPVSAFVWDDNPASPTYYFGRFGQVPRFYSSPMLTTVEQCADAAAAILARELGTTQSVNFGSVVNPALEPGDVVRITRERAGINEDHVLDSVVLPLSADAAMSGSTRATVTT